eukprot:TRINITY_DN5857_c0_g1_i1.p1 TRINITY_DN5857_c0_g1~~TRINITY_DN5857_c0_g1_i1.p1  ORF type:complete len:447 (-),score=67.43 TRINITY_DN5857_c0_g1_i1:9-1349(-)
MGYAGEDTPRAVFSSYVGVRPASSSYVTATNTTTTTTVPTATASDKGKARAVEEEEERGTVGVGGNGGTEGGDHMTVETLSTTDKRYVVGPAVNVRRDGMEIENPMTNGVVHDWTIAEKLLEYGFKKRLNLDAKHHPILLAEPTFNTRDAREKATEMIFEKFQVPALFIAKNAVLTTFASGRSSALVVDSGGSTTSVAAVHEGYALTKTMMKNGISGDFLSSEYNRLYQSREGGPMIRPRYCLQKKEIREGQFSVTVLDFPDTTASYRQYCTTEIARDIKETSGRISDTPFDSQLHATIATVQYELPDGKILEVGTERFRMPEYHFMPDHLPEDAKPGGDLIGIPQMINSVILNSDTDVRRDLYSGIILTGGSTLFPGFLERVQRDLSQLAQQRFKIIAPPSPLERRFSVWIGGSILGSLGTFQQMWISKAEYEEHGVSLVERKCP